MANIISRKKFVSLLIASVFSFNCLSATFPLVEVFNEVLCGQAQDSNLNSVSAGIRAKSYLFNYDVGNETVYLDFPKKPKVKKKDGMLFAILEFQEAEYSFLTSLPPVGPVDPNIVFNIFIAQLHQDMPNAEVDYNVHQTNGLEIMDMTIIDNQNDEKCLLKMVVTGNNIYTIAVSFPNGQTSDLYNQFLNSFSVQLR